MARLTKMDEDDEHVYTFDSYANANGKDDHTHIDPALPPGQIFVFDLDDVITVEECDFIVNAIKTYKIRDLESTLGKQSGLSNVKCHSISLDSIAIQNNIVSADIKKTLKKAFGKVKRKLGSLMDLRGVHDLNLREIYGPTKPHYDCPINRGDDRMLSVIIALNDDYKGGVIHFPEQQFSCKLRKLQMIAFPPFWTHPHFVTKPLDGTVRYTVNTWLTFEEQGSPYKDLLQHNTKTFL